jgi:FkbM family methyltransferase
MQNKSFGKNILQGIRLRMGKIFHNPYREVNIGLFKKIYYKHLNPGKTRIHWLFGKEFSYISASELLYGLKEIFVDEIYKQALPPRPYIIDCGANIGLSVIYMKRLYPDAEIIAFEPDEQNYSLLEKNIRSFDLSQVDLRKEAIWVNDGKLKFSSQGSMSSKIETDDHAAAIEVKSTRLKNWLNRRVDFLKIDIEGAEYAVMQDIQANLQVVSNLFLEYHGSFEQNPQLTELFAMISNAGFQFYIKEATNLYRTPFSRSKNPGFAYDVQLNIFCFRK